MKRPEHIAAEILQKLGFEAAPGVLRSLAGGVDDVVMAMIRQQEMDSMSARPDHKSPQQTEVPLYQQGYETALRQLGFYK